MTCAARRKTEIVAFGLYIITVVFIGLIFYVPSANTQEVEFAEHNYQVGRTENGLLECRSVCP